MQRRRKFKPGNYRVVVRFAGWSFQPAVARRAFTISLAVLEIPRTFRAIDGSGKTTTKSVTVNRVLWGLGEEVATRVSLRTSGAGKVRAFRARLFVAPRVAMPFLRGGLVLSFERRVAGLWKPAGRAAARTNVKVRRRFAPGVYRVTGLYAGYKSFRAATARRTFVVR